MHVIEESQRLEDPWGGLDIQMLLGGAPTSNYPSKPLYTVMQVVYCINLRGVGDHLSVSRTPAEGQCTACVQYA